MSFDPDFMVIVGGSSGDGTLTFGGADTCFKIGGVFGRMERLTIDSALNALKGHAETDKVLFSHGSLEVEIYKPERVDLQTPHRRDEVYVIISGSGHFVNGDSRLPFEAGEVLFVAAGVEHRFEEFTADFATWVFFYGPEGGENG